MNFSVLFFVLFALFLAALLAWAARPPRRKSVPADQILETLSSERHYCRLPQIMQALQPEDIRYLRMRGRGELVRRLRKDRQRIALQFVSLLQDDFETLLEASRVLAAMSPEVVPMQEFERFLLSMRFALWCRLLKWKLRAGLASQTGFEKVSEMAGDLSFHLEAATSRMGELSAIAATSPSIRD